MTTQESWRSSGLLPRVADVSVRLGKVQVEAGEIGFDGVGHEAEHSAAGDKRQGSAPHDSDSGGDYKCILPDGSSISPPISGDVSPLEWLLGLRPPDGAVIIRGGIALFVFSHAFSGGSWIRLPKKPAHTRPSVAKTQISDSAKWRIQRARGA